MAAPAVLPTRQPRWIAHGAFASALPARTPSDASLREALGSGSEAVELDVVVTADDTLLARHAAEGLIPNPAPRRILGHRLRRVAVSSMSLAQVRAEVPHTMTLDQAVSVIADKIPVKLDLKTTAAARPLGRWLARSQSRGRFVVCSDSISALTALREEAPGAEVWFTLPQLPREVRRPWWVLLRSVADERDPRELARAVRDLARALADDRRIPLLHTHPFAGVRWRPYLRDGLARLVAATGATGLCVHQWLVTPELVEAAHDLGLIVDAWVVNRERDARRVAACGVDWITSDQPQLIRQAMLRPRLRDRLSLHQL